LKFQEECMQNKRILLTATEELTAWKTEKRGLTYKIMTRLADGSDDAFLGCVFGGWLEYHNKVKKENAIHAEYEKQLGEVTKQMIDFRTKQCKTLHKHMFRDTAAGIQMLKLQILDGFRQQVLDRKEEKKNEGAVRGLQNEMQDMSQHKRAGAKRVLARLNMFDDESLVFTCWVALKEFHRNYQENKEMEEAIEKKQAQLQEYIKHANPNARKVLSMFTNSSETGNLTNVIEAWSKLVAERKEAARLEIEMKAKDIRLNEFVGRRKGLSRTELLRRVEILEAGTLQTIVQSWKKDTVMERMRRFGRERTTRRKQQLDGVKTLFKSFATELETGLKEGTPRVDSPKLRK